MSTDPAVEAGGWSAATERALEETAERLTQIIAVQRDIATAGLDLQAVMQLGVERSQALTGADGAMINLVDGEDMVVRAAAGIAAAALGDRRPLSTTLLRFAIESARPFLIEDTSRDPRVNRELSSRIGERSIICVPFFGGGEVVGSLNVVSSSTERPLTESHRQTMELLAGILSAGISHAAEFEAKRSEVEALGRFQTIFEGAPIGIARIAAHRHAVAANPALEQMLGRSEVELAAMPFERYTHPEDVDAEMALFAELMDGAREHYSIEKRYLGRGGDVIWGQVHASLERDADGRPTFAILMIENITERKAAEEALRVQSDLNQYQALHDGLTGLGNRALFRERVQQEIERIVGEASPHHLAVLMTDLDRFKEVNDSLGHHAGDLVLQQVAARLSAALRGSDTVARLGGDEFGIVLPGMADRAGVVLLIDRIRAALDEPVVVRDISMVLGASIGVALYPDDGSDVDALLQRADVAMYLAKSGQTTYAFYDEELDENDSEQLTLGAELWRAIADRQLVLYFQPKCHLASGEIRSVEALVRWQHPRRGMILPEGFLGLAERGDVMKSLTLYVLEEALAQCASWKGAGLELAVSVNLSTRDLLDFELPREIEQLLRTWGVDSSQLELEITESATTGNPRTAAVLEQLHGLGLRLSIDDFGTGYSFLAHLRQMPVSEIKIDGSLVRSLARDDDDAEIVRSMVDLGRSLGLDVVAEGVESREVWERLRALGCTFAQGFCLAPPMPAAEIPAWIAARCRQPDQAAGLTAPPEARRAGGSWRPPGAARRA